MKLFYNSKQTAIYNSGNFCRNSEKPELFTNKASTYPSIEVIADWQPLTREEIAISHDRKHVDGVLDYKDNNGFGNSDKQLTDSTPWELGSFYYAAQEALISKSITMSPSAGFHHADFYESWNFCTFNGLIITAMLLKQRFNVDKVGIIDFDCHWGNGTDSIIEKLNLSYITHYTFGKFKRIVRKGIGFDQWLLDLPNILKEKFSGSDILFYQAGADAHIEDHFGGELSTEQMKLRDRIVFQFAKDNNIPLVWNLAGGYQEPLENVIQLHENTLIECLKIFEGE
jgi:acetoin utilization deacetylase AcuC-like enzyme